MVRSDDDLGDIEYAVALGATEEIAVAGPKPPLDKVMAVRLSAADWMKLEGEARELGIGPTTLVRMWILERLRRQPGTPQDTFGAIDLFLQRAFREGIMLQTAKDERSEGGAVRVGILLQTPREESEQLSAQGAILFGNMVIG
jgi:hypothetical protein